ncbi:MAG: peptidoglycan D,D-transpeptidase FtsI family protein [Lachnospiraceae bacterium]
MKKKMMKDKPVQNREVREEKQKKQMNPSSESNRNADSQISEKPKRHTNRQIILVTYIVIGLFLGMMGYIVHYVVSDSSEVITNSYNKRITLYEKKVEKGKIISRDGAVLAETRETEDGEEYRYYPYGREYAHVVGYSAKGKAGLEASMNFHLLSSHVNLFDRIRFNLNDQKLKGDNVVTTLDSRLQKVAYDALGDRKGAVVVMESKTGKILAMVSKPDYDPNQIAEQWDSIVSEDDDTSALLNRATQGLYPPGSTFKVLTALEYMREHPDYKKYEYVCQGTTEFEGVPLSCYHQTVHGQVNLKESIAHSCNTSFGNIGMQLQASSFHKFCDSFLFNKELPYDGEYKKSVFELDRHSKKADYAQTAIGQGKTLITPLHNAMIMQTISNGGVMMKPILIDRYENYSGSLVRKFTPESYKKVLETEETESISDSLREVVNSGTASALAGAGYEVAGKTGSADVEEGKAAHAWFTGYTPVDDPEIVVSIVVENAGTGSTYAVPIAKQIMDTYYESVQHAS